jgi:hypothetical protein
MTKNMTNVMPKNFVLFGMNRPNEFYNTVPLGDWLEKKNVPAKTTILVCH